MSWYFVVEMDERVAIWWLRGENKREWSMFLVFVCLWGACVCADIGAIDWGI